MSSWPVSETAAFLLNNFTLCFWMVLPSKAAHSSAVPQEATPGLDLPLIPILRKGLQPDYLMRCIAYVTS